MVPPRRVAPRLATRAAGGGAGVRRAPFRGEGGARAGEGSRGTAADSDRGRAGPRRCVAATRSPGARNVRWTRRLFPPAGRPARSRQRQKGRTATSASGPRRQPASAPSGGHTQRPRRRRGLGGRGCGTCGPDPATVPAAQAPRLGRARRAGRGPGAAGSRGSRAYLCADRGALCPGPGDDDRRRGRQGRHSGGGSPCGAEGGRSGSRCLGRAPSGARSALPALAVEGAASSAPDWIPSLTQLRVGPLHAGTLPPLAGCPRPLARGPARPSVSLTQAHTPRAGAPRSRSHTQRCSRLSRVLYPLTRTF